MMRARDRACLGLRVVTHPRRVAGMDRSGVFGTIIVFTTLHSRNAATSAVRNYRAVHYHVVLLDIRTSISTSTHERCA